MIVADRSFYLKEFEAYNYNTKVFKVVEKEIEKFKISFEIDSSITIRIINYIDNTSLKDYILKII